MREEMPNLESPGPVLLVGFVEIEKGNAFVAAVQGSFCGAGEMDFKEAQSRFVCCNIEKPENKRFHGWYSS